MKYVCIFCEKSLDRVGPESGRECFQPQHGGEVKIIFDYGSRYDWMGSRESTSSSEARMVEVDLGLGPIMVPESDGSKPRQESLDSSKRAERLSSCNHIVGVICDDCFEAKSHLFYGFERSPKGDLKELVE
jgi:hypothetical protein